MISTSATSTRPVSSTSTALNSADTAVDGARLPGFTHLWRHALSLATDTVPSVHSICSRTSASRSLVRSTPRSAEGLSGFESNAVDTPPPLDDTMMSVFSVMNRTSARWG